MSVDQEITDAKVFTVYSWFQSEMYKAGRKIKFPKCRDQTKTYQFRWTKHFVNKCYNEWGLDDKIVGMLLADLVIYAKSHKLLDRGTQLLSLNNIIDICYRGMRCLAEDESSLIVELKSCHEFINEHLSDKNNRVCRLIESKTGGCSNLLYWHNLGHVTEVYIALSKSCIEALARLPQNERAEFPSSLELLRICTHTVTKELLPQLQAVLGPDLRVPPTVFTK